MNLNFHSLNVAAAEAGEAISKPNVSGSKLDTELALL